MRSRASLLLLTLGLSACVFGPVRKDAGVDAGPAEDAGEGGAGGGGGGGGGGSGGVGGGGGGGVAGMDAGSDAGADAGPADAGLPDAGPPDAGPPDAGRPDAGPPDAGPPDSGLPDAGPPDAGPPDAGPPDAGPPDAGPPDAGLPDAGPADAGQPDAGCACSGVCLADGGCVECLADTHCAGSRPACDLATSSCVECLTTGADRCDAGLYCAAQRCVPGCKDDSACGSGVCLPSRDCAHCLSDLECAGGRRCGSGECSAPCGPDAGTCGLGFACCQGRCVDVTVDPRFCGSCDAGCTATQACAAATCVGSAVSSLCALPSAVVLLNGLETDDDAGTVIGEALATACAPPVTVHAVARDAGYYNPVTGQPVRLGELYVVAGGRYVQPVANYLETSRTAYLTFTSDMQDVRVLRPDGGVLVTTPITALTASHDYFVVQLVRTPSGAPVLGVYGFTVIGTRMAAWYVINTVLPNRMSATQRWYLMEWTDMNGNQDPDGADTWRLVATGT